MQHGGTPEEVELNTDLTKGKTIRKFKIINSNVRKSFNSLKEVKNYIEENQPLINLKYNFDYYYILETTERNHQIQFKKKILSQENKDKLWETVIANLDNLKVDLSTFYHSLKHHYNPEPKNWPSQATYPEGFTTHEELSTIGSQEYDKQREFITKILKKYINILRADETKYEFRKIVTDYKPCHAKAICFKNGYIHGYNFLIREGDVVFDRSVVYGRNVNLRGMYQLVDEDFNKPITKKKK